ncbi:DNA repair exonuclease [Suhomyces tanzawaensis NRRL Y-17324]|uniref:Double-strand break repair protein n=1 Tax=Suhomyces tanzawaensis NRRL Y-17324 TaxID=984487 RepID=A0A1E4SRE6_9ASCO|nr:DNA repair exonuclease [Suhomyces tanzawaensis NRRL Y-17324]ODV82086.1 DNA repair exonuclease [Suhomyces tanzawaensis NRRL Y-17324]
MPASPNIAPGPDTISILLTTDNHVGYNENDPIRGDDAWKTFHEITKIAKERDVDMLVQGGDLFHINKPSKKSFFHVMKSLRLNCMGDRACELEMLSDPSLGLYNGFNTVNYEDPNLNISVPVFAISGNHDDATGDGFLLPLDILSISGLINHFGKVEDNEDITVSPLLFQKGLTKLALYGLANVRDERLHRAFRDGLVKFQRPNIHTQQWFNLFCIHQNHAQHTYTSSIPENFLPKFLDFVLWGHEHECIPVPSHNPECGFDVLQAGSSVATSLAEGELSEKFVFILNIKGKEYSIEPVKLRTVRPFVMKEIQLLATSLLPGAASKNDVIEFLSEEAERSIAEANQKFRLSNKDFFSDLDPLFNQDKIPLPLIRLRVDYSGGFEIENAQRFSNRFVGKIANVNDVIQFHKKRAKETDNLIRKTKFVDNDLFKQGINKKKSTEIQLNDLMSEFLKQAELSLLPEVGINDAVQKYIENDDKHILEQFIKKEIRKEKELLLQIDVDDEEFHGADETQTKNAFKHVLAQVKKENSKRAVSYEPEQSPEPEQPEVPKTKTKTTKAKNKAPKKSTKVEKSAVYVSNSESDSETLNRPASSRPSRKSKAKAKLQIQEVEIFSGSDSDAYME